MTAASQQIGQWIPLTDAAHRLGWGYWHTRDAVLRGRLAGFQVGGRWYVEPQALHRLLAKRADEGAAAGAER